MYSIMVLTDMLGNSGLWYNAIVFVNKDTLRRIVVKEILKFYSERRLYFNCLMIRACKNY